MSDVWTFGVYVPDAATNLPQRADTYAGTRDGERDALTFALRASSEYGVARVDRILVDEDGERGVVESLLFADGACVLHASDRGVFEVDGEMFAARLTALQDGDGDGDARGYL